MLSVICFASLSIKNTSDIKEAANINAIHGCENHIIAVVDNSTEQQRCTGTFWCASTVYDAPFSHFPCINVLLSQVYLP